MQKRKEHNLKWHLIQEKKHYFNGTCYIYIYTNCMEEVENAGHSKKDFEFLCSQGKTDYLTLLKHCIEYKLSRLRLTYVVTIIYLRLYLKINIL